MNIFLNTSRRHEILTTSDGVKLSVREWGDPNGKPILLIHGVAQCHLAFARQLAAKELSGYRLVAFDVRGHGESDKPNEVSYYDDHRRWADDVHTVINEMKLDKPLIAGWSMGGRIIGQYLSVHGDKALSGIHLISSRIVVDPRFAGPGPQVPAGIEPGIAGDLVTAAAFVRACFLHQPSPDDFAVMLGYNMLAWPRMRWMTTAWPPRVEESTAALRAVTVPTLITHGTKDALIRREASEHMHSLIAGSKLSIYEDCGHSPFWEFTDRFNREFAEFARQVFK
jgi:pimeloyl-ACP methyl ester carboxylesterase